MTGAARRTGRPPVERSILAALLALAISGCGPSHRRAFPAAPPPRPANPDAPKLLIVGDIGSCDGEDDESTAALLDRLDGRILFAGDLAYPKGTDAAFRRCFLPAFGHLLPRAWAVPGNHEYKSPGAAPFFRALGGRAGTPETPWFAFDHAGWRILMLDGDCDRVGGCGEGSPQLRWLREELASHPARCSVAVSHQPRWSSGRHGGSSQLDALWRELFAARVELLVSGHDHDYERLAPMDADGNRDERGTRQIVVGTGGKSLRSFRKLPLATTEARSSASFGVLELTLGADGYDWRFVPSTGTFTDSGSGRCTEPPPLL